MALCNLVYDHEGFGEAYCHHLQVVVKTRNLNLVLFLRIPPFRKVKNAETPAIPDHWKVNMCCYMAVSLNPLTPNDPYRVRTASLTSKFAFYIFIQQI